ncbi:hypothetical protein [Halomontanus rarus]|uniref:hypothetical protein n=1 Tax=Halomontanus rarus TaxID=3034020 RepID=UPI001A98308C
MTSGAKPPTERRLESASLEKSGDGHREPIPDVELEGDCNRDLGLELDAASDLEFVGDLERGLRGPTLFATRSSSF